MTTLIKIVITAVLTLTLFSCNFDLNLNHGVRGNGEVITVDRATKQFSAIKATEGLDVYITQGSTESITVEADENIQELIMTDIEDGVLRIHTKENIGYASAKKVHIIFKNISSIITTSGSDLYATNTITTKSLTLKSTSGSDMTLDINTSFVDCSSTSGSDITLSGKTTKLIAQATSGSDIKAADLISESSDVRATSGANITINTYKELTANATSGGEIKYYGNPEKINKSDGVSGGIRQQ